MASSLLKYCISHFDDIIKRLNIDDIIDDLIELDLINEDIYLKLYSEHANDRTRWIWNYIINLGEDASCKFINYLKEHSDSCRNLLQNYEEDVDDEKRREAIIQGGFPQMSDYYVVRETLTNLLRQTILKLNWGEKLVVHGMTGFGKSCLVAEVLSDKHIMKNFNFALFWINLGEHHNTDNILCVMWRLYSNLIVLTGEAPLSHCPEDIEKLKDCLKFVFLHERLKNALLILDDVRCSKVIDAFDFKCRLVITTQHKDIVNQLTATFIEVKTGFSLKESMELFKLCLNQTELCEEAKTIASLCKGFPMFMALISSFLLSCKEEAINSTGIWQDLIDEFKDKSFLNDEITDYIDRAINMCLEKLKPTYHDYYFDLVVFDEDVNIMPSVLEIFWQLKRSDIRKIMTYFADKSLVVPYYHKKFGSYVYGIHDLLLHYLKKKCTNIEIFHRKLIDSYMKITDGDFSKLPNDNYILSYIGYHLKNAEMYDKFSIYFDLKFLETKTKAVGHKDVIRDMDLYKTFITKNNPILSAKLNDFMKFIENYGADLYNYPKTDIIQYAFHVNENNWVYKAALEYTINNPEKLYFKFHVSLDRPKNSTIKLDNNITAACFSGDNDNVLVGTSDGQILKFHKGEKFDTFIGHKSEIIYLQLSPDKNSFLSVSNDHTVKWWKFRCKSNRNSYELTNGVPSPKFKQSFWENIHMLEEKSTDNNSFKMNEIDDYIISASFANDFINTKEIITGSNRGKIIIWDVINGIQLKSTIPRGIPAKSVLLTNDCFIFCCGEDIFFFERDNNLSFITKIHDNVLINYLLPLPNGVIAVCDKKITLWNLTDEKEDIFNCSAKINCATISDDANYLVIGDENHFIYVYDLINKCSIDRLDSGHGLAQSLDVSYDNKSLLILLIGLDNKTLKQYQILPQSQNLTYLTTYWQFGKPLIAYATTSNKIKIMRNNTHIYEIQSINDEIKSITFSLYGNKIIYGLNNGDVVEFNYKTKKKNLLMSLNNPVIYLKYFHINDNKDRKINIINNDYSDDNNNDDDDDDDDDTDDNYNGILVASTINKVSIKYNSEFTRSLLKPPIHFVLIDHQLIIVDLNCGLNIIDLNGNIFIIKNDYYIDLFLNSNNKNNNNKKIALTAEFYNEKLLALITNDNKLHCFNIDNIKLPKLIMEFELSCKSRKLKFSPDGILLAVGYDNGTIMVVNMENSIHTPLILHESPIENFYFSPGNETILVSIADQLAWWNLKKLKDPNISTLDLSYWCNKTYYNSNNNHSSSSNHNNNNINNYNSSVPYLLACIKLHGPYVKFFSASKDFLSYLAVDNESNVYLMDVLK